MFQKLESMINTLDKFRHEMDGSRVPKYEQHFIAKRKRDQEFQRKETIRREKKERKDKYEAERREHEKLFKTGSKRRLLNDNPHQKKSTIELFNSYKINQYNYNLKKPKMSMNRVTFYDEQSQSSNPNQRKHGSLRINADTRNRLLHNAINS